MTTRLHTAFFACLLLLGSCSQPSDQPTAKLPSIDGNLLKAHIKKLASDEMQGRTPGSQGEELATAYIADFFRSIELKTSFQQVPLIGVTSTPAPLKLTGRAGSRTLKYSDEFDPSTSRRTIS